MSKATQGADTLGAGKDTLVIRHKRIPVRVADVPQHELKFYLENPRLYTMIRADGKEPTQEEIEETLSKMEHVKVLAQSIKENGGLMDAIFVHEDTNVVLEGNSRLAAYRILAKHDAVKWGYIRAKILPQSITEREIFTLLGQYHIIGKKDWAPFEQAGYLYRQHVDNGVSIAELSSEINLSHRTITHLVSVVQFMIENSEKDVNCWSYYDEYLKSTKIKKARKEYSQLDKIIVKKIRSGEIPRAVDVRDELKKIVEAGGKVLQNFVEGKKGFVDSVHAAIDKGAGHQDVRHLRKFKEWIASQDTIAELITLEGSARKECLYDLKKIQTLVLLALRKMT
ncbi:MAG: hypothetical protein A3G26_04785 [Betaproteobacteria bacterium RIFCSPLOWO2_12_FULL_65_110]|nr:MAG: hypothetical protein A3G26_04785 [Betaproteobacteria bacterium RIFCSPLOWO2_12_FULL_65_110]